MEKRTQRTDETFPDFEGAKNGLIVNNQQKQGSYIAACKKFNKNYIS